jgi:rSAM/selenodomain-associated transferase 1
MRQGQTIAVVIPALNEEASVGRVIEAIPGWVDDIVVGDNGSTDNTAAVAESHGARVVHEPRRGYGSACLKALAALDAPDIAVFLDGDFSDHPDEMSALVDPIIAGQADLVIGSRVRGEREPGALTLQARFGNWLACSLMRLFWGQRYTDLGPFRAIRHRILQELGMRDPDFGWTVEMQIKAARRGVRAMEVPVRYRRRIGRSKVSGTVRGVIGAGTKILSTIFLAALQPRGAPCASRLIVFTRYPQPGTTKTRLIPALGPEGAAELQRAMTEHTLDVCRRFTASYSTAVEVRFAGGAPRGMEEWLGSGLIYRRQGRGDLGDRMLRAMERAIRDGASRTVLIGTDCPELTPELLSEAFDRLDDSDLVLGPASDGGYYLLGLRAKAVSAATPLFRGMPWGTDEILERTLVLASNAGLSVAKLKTLTDVDRPEDIEVWERVSSYGQKMTNT